MTRKSCQEQIFEDPFFSPVSFLGYKPHSHPLLEQGLRTRLFAVLTTAAEKQLCHNKCCSPSSAHFILSRLGGFSWEGAAGVISPEWNCREIKGLLLGGRAHGGHMGSLRVNPLPSLDEGCFVAVIYYTSVCMGLYR